VYADGSVPLSIGPILEDAMISTKGLCIADLLKTLSRQLRNSLESSDKNKSAKAVVPNENTNADADWSEASDDSDADTPFDYDDDDDFGLTPPPNHTARMKTPDNIFQRIVQDFRTVRKAGFRVGKICGVDTVSDNNIVTMSIKAIKLGLSEDTRLAWDLEPSDYVVLLMKYSGEYISFEDAMKRPASQIPLWFRLRKCSKYRPTLAEAIAAFSTTLPKDYLGNHEQKTVRNEDSSANDVELSTFGVGGSIDLLLDSGFLTMMKLRKSE
jgi:ubiquitin-conjugating enzyme E2 Q